MSSSRRRIIRFPNQTDAEDAKRQRQIAKLRTKLDEQRKALARWLARLKRSFHSFEKYQRTIVRLERQLNKLQEE
jgi:DNA primase